MPEDLTQDLDPRKVLRILNECGVVGVDARALKEFMTDLKKLMRSDTLPPVEEATPKRAIEQRKVKKKSDPVALYAYYSALWEKYKPNLPGEDPRREARLRWIVRQKTLFEKPDTDVVYEARTLTERELETRRRGWVE